MGKQKVNEVRSRYDANTTEVVKKGKEQVSKVKFKAMILVKKSAGFK